MTLGLDPHDATGDVGPIAETHGGEYPPDLTEREWWVLAPGDKMPRAPWKTGDDRPVKWNRNLASEERPETSFEEAVRWSEKFDRLQPSVILPPESAGITLIDLDDVIRDGMISPPALEIVRAAGSFAEVSRSGNGIHIFVKGRLPDGFGKVVEYFDPENESLGQLEMYDHGRVAVLTGDRLHGAPITAGPGQELIDRLVAAYVPETCPECGADVLEPEDHDGECDLSDRDGAGVREEKRERSESDRSERRRRAREGDVELDGTASDRSGGSRSPYWSVAPSDVAEPEYSRRTGSRLQGAHPAHGATSPDHADRDSTNFAIFTDKEYWRCFAHGSWGGALDLVAVLEGHASCGDFPDFFERCTDREFLDVCLSARDKYGFSGEPPYRALVAVAREEGLALQNEEEGILGRSAYEVARNVYDRM